MMDDNCPNKFHLDEQEDELEDRITTDFLHCPLCNQQHKTFHCEVCVHDGNFTHSSIYLPHKENDFVMKQLHLQQLQRITGEMETSCEQKIQGTVLLDTMQHRIKLKRERVQVLNKVNSDKRKEIGVRKMYLANLSQKNKELTRTLPKYDGQVRLMQEYVNTKINNLNQNHREKEDLEHSLRSAINKNIKQLIKYIFPIQNVSSADQSGICLSTTKELAEATRTAYFDGHWVVQDSLGELQHMIVAPCLPSSGYYAMYCDWVGKNRDAGVPNNLNDKEVQKLNPAFEIGAALTYTTQLVQVLSFYLNIRLPFKMSCSDFCNGLLSEGAFDLKVCRLNANILYFLYREGISLNDIQPTHTLENLLLFLNTINAAGHRSTPFVDPSVTNFNLIESHFTMLFCDSSGSDSEIEDENKFQSEWESLDIVPPIVPITGAGGGAPQSASLMNSAAASLASIFRGWTGGR